MMYEITRELPLEEVEVETPVATAKSKVLAGKNLESSQFYVLALAWLMAS